MLRQLVDIAYRTLDPAGFDIREPLPKTHRHMLSLLLLFTEEWAQFKKLGKEDNEFGTEYAFQYREQEICRPSRAHLVPEGRFGFASAHEKKYMLLTGNISFCTAITVYNPVTQEGTMAHCSFFNSRYLEQLNVSYPKKFNLEEIIEELIEPSQTINDLQFTLTSGSVSHIAFYHMFLAIFGVEKVKLFCHQPWSDIDEHARESAQGAVQLNCRTGEVSHPPFYIMQTLRKEFLPSSRRVADILNRDYQSAAS
ncbi:MAG: hypothetical protein ROO73_01910 [Roseivirga sp.]